MNQIFNSFACYLFYSNLESPRQT